MPNYYQIAKTPAGPSVANTVMVEAGTNGHDLKPQTGIKFTSTPSMVLGNATAPVNAVAATKTLTFTGIVSDGQTVTIGTRVYEFDTNSSVTAGNVAVDVSGGATASDAVTALVAAITGDTSAVVAAVDGAGDTVDCTALTKGTVGNAIVLGETCTNASWGGGAVLMSGGVDGTVGAAGEMRFDSSYLYRAIAANTTADTNWRRVALGSAF